MIKVGIVGGTGYTGVELLRLLTQHPEVSLDVITSRSEQGIQVADMFPNLRGHLDLAFSIPEVDRLAECDVVYMATPHGVAMNMAPELLDRGVKVIDLGADFRIKDAQLWEQWYHMQHTAKDWITKAVYGLPEVNRDAIREAQLVACPGCYPTSVQLGFLPLLENALVDVKRLVADCKSGVTGAGRGAAVSTLLGEASENVKAYAVDGHRHLPEISQGLSDIAQSPVQLTFVPHLMPMIRGIHATLYSTLTADVQDVQNLYEQRYAHEPFVDVLPPGHFPETRSVKGSNTCRISVNRPQGGDTLVVLVVEDNLVKGAAGQAVQCMNLLFNIKETTGLDQIALLP